MSDVLDGIGWLADTANWWGGDGLASRLLEHVWYSVVATACAVAIGLPIGLLVGHTGRGRFLAANVSGLLRAVPTIGVVILLFRWRPGSVWPILAALVVLAVPPVLMNAAAGVQSLDPGVGDAARGMGLTGPQVLWRVELPCALPLVLAGVRSAANQVIATATVAGVYGLGGLGRFIFSGYGTQRLDVVYGATVAVVALVLTVELLFVGIQHWAVSPGVRPTRSMTRTGST